MTITAECPAEQPAGGLTPFVDGVTNVTGFVIDPNGNVNMETWLSGVTIPQGADFLSIMTTGEGTEDSSGSILVQNQEGIKVLAFLPNNNASKAEQILYCSEELVQAGQVESAGFYYMDMNGASGLTKITETTTYAIAGTAPEYNGVAHINSNASTLFAALNGVIVGAAVANS